MAITHPRTLLPRATASRAEVRLFALLRDALPAPWEVFHSVDLVVRDGPNAGAKDGEVDFVLVHPDEAVVCLEVKGGPLETSGTAWFRPSRDGGPRQRITDPFRQATDHAHDLGRVLDYARIAAQQRLAAGDGLTKRARRQTERLAGLPRKHDLLLVHALALPDLSVHGLTLGADAPLPIIIDAAGTRDLAASIRGVLDYWRGKQDHRRAPGADGVAALRELLAPTVELQTVLAAEFVDEARQLVALTESQTRVLRGLAAMPQVAVSGCAGSGKTMLAVAHAQRLAGQGQDVLLACFNRALAEHLQAEAPNDRITYSTFHGLCLGLARTAGLELPDFTAPMPPEYWRDELPELLLEAIGELGPQWDALIVDEAQDFREHWLNALRWGLRSGEEGPTWLFLDGRQRLFDVGDLRVPDGFVTYELSDNCRTTQAIHRELVPLRRAAVERAAGDADGVGDAPSTADGLVGELEPEATGPEGRPVEVVTTSDQPSAVRAAVERLLGEEGVRPSDLVVLTPRRAERSPCAAALGDLVHVGAPGERPRHQVLASSIRAYKGLESDVVVLCELDRAHEGTEDAQRYVALSRARHHVVEVRAA